MSDKWTEDKLSQFRAEFLEASKSVKTTAESVALIERALPELRDAMSALKAAKPVEVPSETEAAVIRAYCNVEVPAAGTNVAKSVSTNTQTRPILANGNGVVRMYGHFDEFNEWKGGLLDDKPKTEWQAKAQEYAEQLSVVRAMGVDCTKTSERYRRHMKAGPAPVAKMFSDVSGFGAELLPDITMPVLQREAEAMRTIETWFPQRNVGPGGGHRNPFMLKNSGQMFGRSAIAPGELTPGEIQKSDLAFTDLPFAIPSLLGAVLCDLDASEDAILEWLPIARTRMAETDRDAMEDCIINGDDAATHQDTGLASWSAGGRWPVLGSPNDHRRLMRGLRATAFDVPSSAAVGDQSATATAVGLMADVSRLQVAQAMGAVAHIVSPRHFLARLVLDANVLTVDKFGPSATILTGAPMAVGGRPVGMSEFFADDMASSGLFTGSGSTGGRLTFNRNRFEIVQRRGLQMSIDVKHINNAMYLVARSARLFRSIDPVNTRNVYYGFNLPTTPA